MDTTKLTNKNPDKCRGQTGGCQEGEDEGIKRYKLPVIE